MKETERSEKEAMNNDSGPKRSEGLPCTHSPLLRVQHVDLGSNSTGSKQDARDIVAIHDNCHQLMVSSEKQLTLCRMFSRAELRPVEGLVVILVHMQCAKIPCVSVPSAHNYQLTPWWGSFGELAMCQSTTARTPHLPWPPVGYRGRGDTKDSPRHARRALDLLLVQRASVQVLFHCLGPRFWFLLWRLLLGRFFAGFFG